MAEMSWVHKSMSPGMKQGPANTSMYIADVCALDILYPTTRLTALGDLCLFLIDHLSTPGEILCLHALRTRPG